MRNKILRMLEKNSRIDLKDLAVMLRGWRKKISSAATIR